MSERVITSNRPAYRALLNELRRERESRGLTQQQIADSIGIPPSSLAKWERGVRRIDVLDLRDYLKACGVDFQDFTSRWSRLADDLETSGAEVKLFSRPRKQMGPDDRLR